MKLRGAGKERRLLVRAVFIAALFVKCVGTGNVWAEAGGGAKAEVQPKKSGESKEVKAAAEEREVHKELESLKKNLLRHPKKKRLSLSWDSTMTYNDNVANKPIHKKEKGDTTFNLNPTMGYDLSGRKTDLRFEYRGGRTYNVKRPEGDSFNMEWNLRFGRKIFKKVTLSLNDRLTRQSVPTTQADTRKVSWANSHQAGLNYEFNRKLSFNLQATNSRTDFPHETFDQDASFSQDLSPDIVFQPTPKTRLTTGYTWGITRGKKETGDNTKHNFKLGYSGRLTRKSSLSANLGYNIQTPDSADGGGSYSLSTSVGDVWQVTPKLSHKINYSHTRGLSTSNAAVGSTFSFTKSLSVSDGLTLSSSFRLNRKISTELSSDLSHSRSKARTISAGQVTSKTLSRTFTLPLQISLNYKLADWISLRISYTHRHQLGNERKTQEFRSNTWVFSTNAQF